MSTRHPSLTIASLAGALLFTVHLAHDFIHGLDRMSRPETFTYLLIMVVWLYGTLELSGRRAGYAIMLIAGVLATALPVLHTVGGERSGARGFFWVWTLLALGATGVFAVAISTRELTASFRARGAK